MEELRSRLDRLLAIRQEKGLAIDSLQPGLSQENEQGVEVEAEEERRIWLEKNPGVFGS